MAEITQEASFETVAQKVSAKTFQPHQNNISDKALTSVMQTSFEFIRTEDSGVPDEAELYDLQSVVNNAQPNAVITLPPSKVTVNSLVLRRPVTLKGVPGTVLELLDGSVSLLMSAKSKALISELALVFWSEAADACLFDLHSGMLEVRDCDIRSVSRTDEDDNESSDVCFQFVNPTTCRLLLDSCSISGFHHVMSGVALHVEVTRCHLFECSSTALVLENPRHLALRSTRIENCQGSALSVWLSLDLCAGTDQLVKRHLTVEDCDIRSVGEYGVLVASQEQNCLPFSILLARNRVAEAGKDGVCVRHCVLQQLEISSNEFKSHQRHGCSLVKVTSVQGGPSLVAYNRCCYCRYGLHLEQSEGLLHNNEAMKNLKGGLLVLGCKRTTSILRPLAVQVRKGLYSHNKGSGIIVCNFLSGSVSISGCWANLNEGHGIHLYLEGAHPAAKLCVDVKDCRVLENRQFGISVHKQFCSLTGSQIEGNGRGSVNMDEDSASFVYYDGVDRQCACPNSGPCAAF